MNDPRFMSSSADSASITRDVALDLGDDLAKNITKRHKKRKIKTHKTELGLYENVRGRHQQLDGILMGTVNKKKQEFYIHFKLPTLVTSRFGSQMFGTARYSP
jgi:alpha-D-ribose 1-methylphosphonate 5-triphosphate synthase subunit PhnI